jgi:hypothetical protein
MFESLRSLYDTRTASDAGEWVELFAPGTIEPATDPATGKRLRLKVLGPDSPRRQAGSGPSSPAPSEG